MKPGVLAAIIVVVLVAVGAFVFIGSEEADDTDTNTNTATSNQVAQSSDDEDETEEQEEAEEESANVISVAMVAEHASEDDCWTIINGSVYDITSYIPRHPGGVAIVQACGTDGSSLFNERTTEDGETVGSGTPHSNNASNALDGFKIGDLAQ